MSVNKEVIEKIRTSFLALVQENSDKFHPADVERVKENDWWIERFVLVNKSEEAALKALVKTMEWRKTFGVNDFTDDYFPQEIYKIGLYHTNFKDKEDRPVMWGRIGMYHKSELTPLIKKFLVYQFEKLDRQTSHQGWATISDSTGSGLSNIDMDFSNFMTDILQTHYPRGPKYMAVVDLPWILNATAKLVMSFMNEELKNSIKFIKKDELPQYIGTEYIPVHL